MFYINENGGLSHHGILGMKWGVRRFQPYRKGERVKGGKEIGQATKVKQKLSPVEKAKKQAARAQERAEVNRIKTQTKNTKATARAKEKASNARARAEVKIQKAIAKQAKQRQKVEVKSIREQMKSERSRQETQTKQQKETVSRESFEAAKKKAIESGSAADVAKYKGKMTNQELQQAVTRLNLEEQLSKKVTAEQKTAMDRIDNLFKTGKKMTDWAETGLKIYATINKVAKTAKTGEVPKDDKDKKKKK